MPLQHRYCFPAEPVVLPHLLANRRQTTLSRAFTQEVSWFAICDHTLSLRLMAFGEQMGTADSLPSSAPAAAIKSPLPLVMSG